MCGKGAIEIHQKFRSCNDILSLGNHMKTQPLNKITYSVDAEIIHRVKITAIAIYTCNTCAHIFAL